MNASNFYFHVQNIVQYNSSCSKSYWNCSSIIFRL